MVKEGKEGEEIIVLKNIWKIYKMGAVTVEALKGIDLKIRKRDFMMILGPSGSGKSTMMNMVGALDVPTRGTIYLDGHDISKLHASDLAQIRGKKIGFIFQQFNLIPVLTALQNVSLPMMFQEVPAIQREKRAVELLKMVGLGERINHKPTEMSGGEQQRVAIARALANDPEVILADEPTGNLDSKTGGQVMDILIKLHLEKKKTIILITHDNNLVKHAHRVIYLKDGKVLKEEMRKRTHD
ncbi:MAG: ABC transporter ATP-binding protein [archaeon]|nr:ABC transporter ATP-binding protein [archaeon]